MYVVFLASLNLKINMYTSHVEVLMHDYSIKAGLHDQIQLLKAIVEYLPQ